MFRGNNVIKFCGSDVVWISKWDVGGEADLSQLHADGGRCREGEVESEKREEEPLKGYLVRVLVRAMLIIASTCGICIPA